MLESENIDPNKLRFNGFRDWARVAHGLTKTRLDKLSIDDYSKLMAEFQAYLEAERNKPQPKKRYHRDPTKPQPTYELNRVNPSNGQMSRRKSNRHKGVFND